MKDVSHGEEMLPSVVSVESHAITSEAAAGVRFSFSTPSPEVSLRQEKVAEERQEKRRRTGFFCVLLLLGLLGLTLPMAYHAASGMSAGRFSTAPGEEICRGILSHGLPPLNADLLSVEQDTLEWVSEIRTSEQAKETQASEPRETVPFFEGINTEGLDPPSTLPVQSAPILTADMSESHKGWDYLLRDGECRVPALPETVRFSEKATVLILHSHPYEAYGDGGDTAWHNGEGWAVKLPRDGRYADDGVVSLGEQLTLLLRLRGVRVIHAVLPADAPLSHMDTYEETKQMLSEMLSSYPQIAWVIDLRRGAEQTEDGCILRTHGVLDGTATAQLRIWVDSRNTSEAQGKDLRIALNLREHLFAGEPTLSRPVYLRRGEGLCEGGETVMLTLEFGTAGNTFSEAARLLVPVADAITDCLREAYVYHKAGEGLAFPNA